VDGSEKPRGRSAETFDPGGHIDGLRPLGILDHRGDSGPWGRGWPRRRTCHGLRHGRIRQVRGQLALTADVPRPRQAVSKTALIAALALCLGHAQANGQGYQESVSLGSTELTLGMPQNAVIAALAAHFRLDQQSSGIWIVSTKRGPPFDTIGSLSFVDNRLATIRKYWGPENQQRGFEFASRLYWALKGLTANGREDCAVELSDNEGPAYNIKSISITCGGRAVEISTTHSEKGLYAGDKPIEGSWASIDEVLSRPK
jgi:hypothetical protein